MFRLGFQNGIACRRFVQKVVDSLAGILHLFTKLPERILPHLVCFFGKVKVFRYCTFRVEMFEKCVDFLLSQCIVQLELAIVSIDKHVAEYRQRNAESIDNDILLVRGVAVQSRAIVIDPIPYEVFSTRQIRAALRGIASRELIPNDFAVVRVTDIPQLRGKTFGDSHRLHGINAVDFEEILQHPRVDGKSISLAFWVRIGRRNAALILLVYAQPRVVCRRPVIVVGGHKCLGTVFRYGKFNFC